MIKIGKKKTHKEFINQIYQLVGEEYSVEEEYIDSRTPIKIKHKICNYEWPITPDNFLRGQRCPQCQGLIKKNIQQIINEIYTLVNDEYTVLSKEYVNANTPIIIRHNICNHEYPVTPNKFINQNTRCPLCAGNIKKTTGIFKKDVFDLVKDEYSVLGEYINARTNIKMRHNICLNEYPVTPINFLKGRRCPFCAESKGEQEIRHWLNNNLFYFIPQYKINDCKNIEPLPFDFAIFKDKEKTILNLLIEYDGEFHYKPILGKAHLAYQKYNDEIKNKYCQINNINLLRIPYWKFDDVTKILEKQLCVIGGK